MYLLITTYLIMKKKYFYLFALIVASVIFTSTTIIAQQKTNWNKLKAETRQLGKKEWRPMLSYIAALHEECTKPAEWPFKFEWEDIGKGYLNGPAFGHWDIIHECIDVMPSNPQHVFYQLMNNLQNQEPNGLIPGVIWMPGGIDKLQKAEWNKNTQGHPPVWVIAVDDYIKFTKSDSILKYAYPALIRQITWFENERKATGEGFYYNDILLKEWESGVDEGVRFDETSYGKWACIDATSHVSLLYKTAVKWSDKLKLNNSFFKEREDELNHFIRDSLWSIDEGMFYDKWAIDDKKLRHFVIENFDPMVFGIATKRQADILIDNYLLNPAHFLTTHPIPTVSVSDPKFELRMWRGPSWNSMTYWIARSCINYGRKDAAKIILERALDASAKQFNKTGKIWEFYHPLGGDPSTLKRKPHSMFNKPFNDYLGHNPLIEMARMYEKIKAI